MRAAILFLCVGLLFAPPAMAEQKGIFTECKGKEGEGSCIDHEIQHMAQEINGVLDKKSAEEFNRHEKAANCGDASLADTAADAVEDLANCKITLMQITGDR